MGGSLWQKDSLVTFIFFELCLLKYFSPVANFGYQSLHNSVLNDLSFVIWIQNKILKTDNSMQPFMADISHAKIRNAELEFES